MRKIRASVCLAVKGYGSKLKPFVVFVGAKHKSKSLHEEYKHQCSAVSNRNGWINEKLTIQGVNKIGRKFAIRKGLLQTTVMKPYDRRCEKSPQTLNTENLIVPEGCTKYIQAPDLVWNKSFKQRVGELCDEWLSNGVHEFTKNGNMKLVP